MAAREPRRRWEVFEIVPAPAPGGQPVVRRLETQSDPLLSRLWQRLGFGRDRSGGDRFSQTSEPAAELPPPLHEWERPYRRPLPHEGGRDDRP